MGSFWQDLRFGVRMLIKKPGLALIAILTLALGIGANTAIFSIVNAVLLRPLPYAEPERLVAIWESNLRRIEGRFAVSYANFFDWRSQNQSFERVAAYYVNDQTLTEAQTAQNIRGSVVSSDLFAVLGVKPLMGRWFLPEEENAGNRSAVISQSLWRRQFGADPGIIGRNITLNGKTYQIVGVTPGGFQFPIDAEPIELWITSAIDHERSDPNDPPQSESRGSHFLSVIGRLKSGVSMEQAQAEMSLIAANLEGKYPDTNKYHGAGLASYHRDLVADYSAALWLILGAVGCVLLIACANIANLLLARATARHREIAVRTALGADRRRVIRQLLTESLLLAFIGGLMGLLVAWWGTELLIRLIPEDLPRLAEIRLDGWVFGFTSVLSAATGIVFGLAPAIQASKIDLTEAIKDGGRGSGVGFGRGRLRSALVVGEIAIALIVLIAAGLLLQTFRKLQRVDLGFDTRGVLTASVELPDARYKKPDQIVAFYQALLGRIKTLPGVESASAIMPLPLSGDSYSVTFETEGRNIAKGDLPSSNFRDVALDYFTTMKIPLVAGRDFSDRDMASAPLVMVVNESFARRFFPNESPIGKRIKPGVSFSGDPLWREIVGVVKDVKHRQSLGRDYEPEYYMPHAQMPFQSMYLTVRAAGDPRDLVRPIEAAVEALDRDLPVFHVKTLEQYLGVAVAQPRFNALLLALFAVLALSLTVIGLYGVMSYVVLQRTREIGVRIALGAQTSDVLRLVLRQGLWLTLIGLAIGLTSAFALTRYMQRLLFGVEPTDPLTFLGIAVLLTVVSLLACWIPARRAARVDPIEALRSE